MYEERKLNKAIKQDGIDTQSGILDELKRRYPQYAEQSVNKQAPVRKKRVAVIFALAAAAACLAIVVPCAVLLPNNNNGNGGDVDRYCGIDEFGMCCVDYTIGEYRENKNRDFLCFDWYELGEDCNTVCYISNSDNEVLCLEENIYLPQSDEFVQLSITKSNVYLSIFDETFNLCKSKQSVNNHIVKWFSDEVEGLCIFEEGGYRYFIRLEQGKDENRLFELVTELLETK